MFAQPTIKRLTVSRFLYGLAERNGLAQSDVAAFAAVTLLQDAIEIFLLVAADHLNAEIGKRTEFDQYIDKINEKISPDELPYRVRLSEINKVRVLAKHSGVQPNRTEVSGYLATTRNFLRESCEKIFKLNFWTVSLSELIEEGERRDILRAAELAYQRGEYSACLIECRKIMFLEVEKNYDVRVFLEDNTNNILLHVLKTGGNKSAAHKRNKRWVEENVHDPFDYIQLDHREIDSDLMKMGLDSNLYWNIWRLTPRVYRQEGGSWLVRTEPIKLENEGLSENAEYVLGAATEVLLTSQLRKHSLKWLNNSTEYTAPLIGNGVRMYSRASRNSELVAIIVDVQTIPVRYHTPALSADEDGGFWRTSGIEIDGEWFQGYVHEDDIALTSS